MYRSRAFTSPRGMGHAEPTYSTSNPAFANDTLTGQTAILLKLPRRLVQAHTVSISQRRNCYPPRAVIWLEQFTDRPGEVAKTVGW